MNKILTIIVNLFRPQGLRHFKKMSIFIAMLIFLASFWMLILPVKSFIKNHSDETASTYEYTKAFYNVKDLKNLGIGEIKNSGYKLSEGIITSNIENEDIKIYSYSYILDEENICCYYVFDVNDKLDKKIANLIQDYLNLYTSEVNPNGEVSSRVEKIVKLSLVKINKGKTKEEAFAIYKPLSDEDIDEAYKNIKYYELYGVEEREDYKSTNKNYSLIFNKEYTILTTPTEEKDVINVISNTNLNFDLENSESISDFSRMICVNLVQAYNDYTYDIYTLYSIIIIIVYPFLFSAIMWLCFKRKGILTKFKEYYNVSSLTSILPTIVTFICSWFVGSNTIRLYGLLFTFYSVIMVFITATKEDKETDEKVQ